jgi:DNA-binding PadR family transcriptional regulator
MPQSPGKVPRGFTRYYVLYLLSENELTGKDIIDESVERSEGDWAPSPGLIYPLLGRLVRDGFIAELDGGKFTTTEDGIKELSKQDSFQDQLETQFSLMEKLGLSMYTKGKMLADETIDRISRVTATAWDKVTTKSGGVQHQFEEKYEEFLLAELERIKQKKTQNFPFSEEELGSF